MFYTKAITFHWNVGCELLLPLWKLCIMRIKASTNTYPSFSADFSVYASVWVTVFAYRKSWLIVTLKSMCETSKASGLHSTTSKQSKESLTFASVEEDA